MVNLCSFVATFRKHVCQWERLSRYHFQWNSNQDPDESMSTPQERSWVVHLVEVRSRFHFVIYYIDHPAVRTDVLCLWEVVSTGCPPCRHAIRLLCQFVYKRRDLSWPLKPMHSYIRTEHGVCSVNPNILCAYSTNGPFRYATSDAFDELPLWKILATSNHPGCYVIIKVIDIRRIDPCVENWQ